MRQAADECDLPRQLVALAAGDDRLSLDGRPQVIEPKVDGYDRLEMSERHPNGRAATGVEQADDRARCQYSFLRNANQLLAPGQGQLDPILRGITIFQGQRTTMADLADQFEKALGIEPSASLCGI